MEPGQAEDLALLSDLTEQVVLNELGIRYSWDGIYTYIGDILIAVNPYKRLPIYGHEIGDRYTNIQIRNKLRPHIYALADKAYQNLRRNSVSQCCVVSGESGAGKTESTKLLVEHIVRLCQLDNEPGEFHDLHERIVQVNPLLEAFGNAQTVMNNNSSRFGKFIELLFTESGHIVGAKISEYLLEKSRVVHHGYGERNFHVFYYMFAGLNKQQLRNFLLERPENHRILQRMDRGPIYFDEDDFLYHRDMLERLRNIMAIVGFTRDETETVFAMLSAVLHITDIQFAYDRDTDGVFIVDEYILDIVADLLGVSPEYLASALISNVNILRGERIVSMKNLEQATDGRDALAKALYSRLFGWIVQRINTMLTPRHRHRGPHIGILDIAGFENFRQNSFEQLCINVTNEQLQFYFNQHIFTWEGEEYKREGIKGTNVQFETNRPLLDMFLDRPGGFFALLDEESKFPKSSDASLLEKLKKQLGKHTAFIKPKGKELIFSIRHYAGQVLYNCQAFLEKNRDTLSGNILECMQNSESQIVSDLFSARIRDTGTLELNPDGPQRSRKSVLQLKDPNRRTESLSKKAGKKLKEKMKSQAAAEALAAQTQTAGLQFRNSLTDLMNKLLDGEPQFIRCIKPNHQKRPGEFNPDLVQQQLRYTGVMETVRIRRLGYSTRLSFEDFLRRYRYIAFPLTQNIEPLPLNCFKVISKADLHDWEIGKHKIFLKYYHAEQLNIIIDRMERHIILVQKFVRGYIARQYFRRLKALSDRDRAQVRSFCMTVSEHSDNIAFRMRENRREDLARFEEKVKQEKEMKHWQQVQRQTQNEDYNKLKAEEYLREQRQQWEKQENKHNGSTYDRPTAAVQPAKRRTPVSTVIDERYQYNSLQSVKSSKSKTEYGENSHYARRSAAESIAPVIDVKTFYENIIEETRQLEKELTPHHWCRAIYLERDQKVGSFNIRAAEFVVDGSEAEFDGYRIGMGYLQNPLRDEKTARIKQHIGKGILLTKDDEGNIWATRQGKNDIIIKGYKDPAHNSISEDVVLQMGYTPFNKAVKIFDMHEFKSHIALEMTNNDSFDFSHLRTQCIVSFSFLRDSEEDLLTPCWVAIVNLHALNALKSEKVIREIRMSLAKAKFEDANGHGRTGRQWSKINQRQELEHSMGDQAGRKSRIELRKQSRQVGQAMEYSWQQPHQSQYVSAPELSAREDRKPGKSPSKKGWIRVMSPLKENRY